MPSPAQLQALADYDKARHDHDAAEQALLSNYAAIDDARKARDAAVASGDQLAVDALTEQLHALDIRADKARQARDRAGVAMSDARTKALAGGAGFDLLSGRYPLLLLPVRLETRFAWIDAGHVTFKENAAMERVLLVRVYPDDIHTDSHEPQLTADELDALTDFRKKIVAARDLQPLQQAWIELASRVGPARANWIGELAISMQRPGRRATRFSRPTVARLLPDCWLALAYLDDGSTLSATSGPISEPLEIGVSPGALSWMTDFDAALKAGMALMIRNLPAGVARVQRLKVVGVRGTLNAQDSKTALEQLLRAQQFTRSLELLAPGTPTNSLPGARTAYASRPSPADIAEVNLRRYLIGGGAHPLCQSGDERDGTILATLLGIDVATFGYVKRADAIDQRAARAIRALWTAATERTLIHQLATIAEPDTVRELLDFGVRRVSALGPCAALRVGPQPYGVLPILRRDATQTADGSNARRYLPMLDRLRSSWEAAASTIDRVGKPGADPGETLIRILQQDGVARRIAFRPFIGPQLAESAIVGITKRESTALDRQQKIALRTISAIGINALVDSPLLRALHLSIAPPLAVPLIQPDSAPAGSLQRASNYLELAATIPVDALFRNEYPNAERPLALLFAIARLAVLEQADTRVRERLAMAGADPTPWDDEDLPSPFNNYYASMQHRLEWSDPAALNTPVAALLSEHGQYSDALASLRQALRDLKGQPPELLDELVRASLCLFSSRLDAWYTALASDELMLLRDDPATALGIHVGAYGVLEEIAQSPRSPVAASPGVFTNPMNGGYIHAPSVNQGAAAAVLRSVHLAHSAAGHGEAFSVDLSSARVRRGLELTDGIRSGQPLAALIGYQVERELRQEQLARFIAPLRGIAPLIANKLTPSSLPAESVAASNVVDGLTLLAESGYDGQQPASVSMLWTRHPTLGPALSTDEEQSFARVLASAQDAVDAVADLAVAESVYQAVQGNPVRTGATVDSLSGAPVPPSEFSIVHTPRSGVGVTHRLMVLLGDTVDDEAGWRATPRALAEPRLESWARSILPKPSQIWLRARFVNGRGAEVARLEDISLAALLDSAAASAPDLLLGALDLVALADPHDMPQRSALEVRLSALLDEGGPASTVDTTLELILDRGSSWDAGVFSLTEALEIAKSMRDLFGQTRALTPADFGSPGKLADAAINTVEATGRATAAANALNDVQTRLMDALTQSSSEIRKSLFAAESLGIVGAAPVSLRDRVRDDDKVKDLARLQAQVSVALAEVKRRVIALTSVAADDPIERLKVVFGNAFVALPTLIPPTVVGELFASGAGPSGGDEPAARTWLARAARIRENVGRLDEVLGGADAVLETAEKGQRQRLQVAQIGGAPGEPWVALPLQKGASMPGGRASLVAVLPGGSVPKTNVAGLLVDEWVDVVPAASETTSVAFHFDAPTSTPPQVMLVGVPYRTQELWTDTDAFAIVDEALALARIRLVDTDVLPHLGQLFPALMTPESPANERAGLDIEWLTEPRPGSA